MSHRRVRPVDESDEDEDERPARRRRAASPANSEPDAQHPQAQVLQQKDANKKPVARDYEPRAQAILDRAFTLYKVKLTKLNAYPDKLKERTWAKQAWAEAAQDLKINLIPDERALVLIMRYTCNLRGEIKGGARALVQSTYGFQSAATKDSKEGRANRAHAEYLLANRRFTYKVSSRPDGLYEHPIIQSLVNRVYYKHPTDDGIIHQDHYNIFPLAGIALILTAVHCAIQEWSTGVFDAVRFEEGKFVSIYVEHVDNLKEYEMKSEDDRIVSELGRQLAETGRAHAKAPPQSVSNSEGISSSDIDRAVAAYRLRKRRERDGLN
ncbi:hypothetical protein C8Q76DRAFT_618970 [Earliella scabrosa]|nr:hypothetical protein C8Q76DRAFT_618970 [Earliella scabrosa]